MWPLSFAHLTLPVCIALFRVLGAQRDCEITDMLWNHWHAQNSTRPWAIWFKVPVLNMTLDQMTNKHRTDLDAPASLSYSVIFLVSWTKTCGCLFEGSTLEVSKGDIQCSQIWGPVEVLAWKYSPWKKWWCLENLRCQYQVLVDCIPCKGLDSTQVTFKAIWRGQREASCSLFMWCLCSACLPREGCQP